MNLVNRLWRQLQPRVLRLIALFLAASLLSPFLSSAASAQVSIRVLLKDTLSFEPSTISVQPGETLNLTLVNDGIVDHTFTLFAEPDARVPVEDLEALLAYYQQEDIIVDVLVRPGDTGWANFTAPKSAAKYIFVCMIPGHAVGGMHGVLLVGSPSDPGPGFSFEIGLIQAILIAALVGTIIFAAVYHLRSTRPG
jgi:uncharacterized cupredoxin-like copper-binding protein